MLLALAARVCAAEAAASAASSTSSPCRAAAVTAAAAIADRATARRSPHTSAPPQSAAEPQQQRKKQQSQPPTDTQAPAFDWQRPRLETLYRDHVSRALLLKLDVRSVNELPSLGGVSLAVRAGDASSTPGTGASSASSRARGRGAQGDGAAAGIVDRWEMLLPALALEFLTGRPAALSGPGGKYYRERGAASAAHVSLRGRDALALLEKLSAVALPGQSAFGGVLMRAVDAGGGVHFRLPSMLAFPDYEEAYETFEGLGAAHVSVGVDPGAWRPRGRRRGHDAAAREEADRQRRREREQRRSGGGGEGEEEEEEVDASPVGVAGPRGAKGPAEGAVAARTQMLLTGLQFPLLAKRRGPGDAAEEE